MITVRSGGVQQLLIVFQCPWFTLKMAAVLDPLPKDRLTSEPSAEKMDLQQSILITSQKPTLDPT